MTCRVRVFFSFIFIFLSRWCFLVAGYFLWTSEVFLVGVVVGFSLFQTFLFIPVINKHVISLHPKELI